MQPVTPPGCVPEVAPYTVMLDAISKSLASTGLRVGWSVAAPAVTQRMSDLLGHVGAWAPRAEQIATAEFLGRRRRVRRVPLEMHRACAAGSSSCIAASPALARAGLPVESVAPEGTLYLSARIDLFGRDVAARRSRPTRTSASCCCARAGIAVVPFQAFGLDRRGRLVPACRSAACR
jgi:aspartate aminotransferase